MEKANTMNGSVTNGGNVLDALQNGTVAIDWNMIKAAARNGTDTFEWFISSKLYDEHVSRKVEDGSADWLNDWVLEYQPSSLSNDMGKISFKPISDIANVMVKQGLVRNMRKLDDAFETIPQYNMTSYYSYVTNVKFGDVPAFQRLLLKVAIHDQDLVDGLVAQLAEIDADQFDGKTESEERAFIKGKLSRMRNMVIMFCNKHGITYPVNEITHGMLNAIGHRLPYVIVKLRTKPSKPNKHHVKQGKKKPYAKKHGKPGAKKKQQPNVPNQDNVGNHVIDEAVVPDDIGNKIPDEMHDGLYCDHFVKPESDVVAEETECEEIA